MGAFGVFAQGQPSVPSTITLNNSMLTTTGGGAVGYRADGAHHQRHEHHRPDLRSGGARWDAEQRRYGHD